MLRSWAEHYRSVTSQRAFNTISYEVWKSLWRKLVKRHRRRSKGWIYRKYFRRKKGNKWIFVAGKGSERELALFQISYVSIKRHSLVSNVNAYDVKVNECFAKANVAHSKTKLLHSNQADYLLKIQKGVCPVCEQSLLDEESVVYSQSSTRKRGKPRKYDGILVHRVCGNQLKATQRAKPLVDQ